MPAQEGQVRTKSQTRLSAIFKISDLGSDKQDIDAKVMSDGSSSSLNGARSGPHQSGTSVEEEKLAGTDF